MSRPFPSGYDRYVYIAAVVCALGGCSTATTRSSSRAPCSSSGGSRALGLPAKRGRQTEEV